MMSIVSMLGMFGCEDRMDVPRPSTGEGKSVEVSLCVGIADEVDAASLGGGTSGTKAGEGVGSGSGLDVRLRSSAKNKAVTDDPLATAKPDKLYGLEIWQYDAGGNFKTGKGMSSTSTVEIGSSFTVTLEAMDNCQLVIIARGHNGSDYTVDSLSGKSLSAVQGTTATASTINGISSADDIKAMPYILYLPKVNVTSAGKIQSPDGTDVRILLRRLATRLTLSWKNIPANTGYILEQVMLQSIPVDYRLLKPVNDDTYPSLLDQYTTIQVPNANTSDEGSYTCWIPSVVRGESAYATSAYYRTKANAPKGSAYATFISRHKSGGGGDTDSRKKLNYRVYLGGSTSKEFDLYDNTNYIYNVEMSHTALPVDDRRVTIIDPIPASQNNTNLVPTANCFMVKPGGAFCFNPYDYYANGATGENTILRGWCGFSSGTSTPIKSVKVLWQTLEDGDLGDPVLGVVNKYAPETTDDDHTNIVELKNGDNLTGARIYCRVAPNTSGGSGVIAAYDDVDGKGNILWSWHVWVTDYSPDATGATSVFEPETKRKHLYVSNSSSSQYPMMDRNLGAFIGLERAPVSRLEMTKANGFHYQRGRKDPFPGTYTTSEGSDFIAVINPGVPPKNLLNRYKGDGLTWIIVYNQDTYSTLQAGYRKPLSIGATTRNHDWCSEQTNGWNTEAKGIHDPCPAGWRIPLTNAVYQPLIDNNTDLSTGNDVKKNGGVLLSYHKDYPAKKTYIRYAGYPTTAQSVIQVGINGYLNAGTPDQILELGLSGSNPSIKLGSKWNTDAHSVRCIQERTN